MNKKEHELTLRVYYEDTDAGGIVYHANYLRFLERGRTEWLRDLGFEQDALLEQNVAFVVRHMNADFLLPAKFNQQLSIHTQVVQLKGASMKFKQTIKNEQQAVCFSAEVLVACISHDSLKPCRIPAQILGEITRVI
jgi:acyl-CoA thioester hydrolase